MGQQNPPPNPRDQKLPRRKAQNRNRFPSRAAPLRAKLRRRARPGQSRQEKRLRRSKSRTPKSGFAPTSFRKSGCAKVGRALPPTIGWKRAASWKSRRAAAADQRQAAADVSGTQARTFSRRRLIVKGFGRNPATRASFSNSWARSSWPWPETSSSGGIRRAGVAFS